LQIHIASSAARFSLSFPVASGRYWKYEVEWEKLHRTKLFGSQPYVLVHIDGGQGRKALKILGQATGVQVRSRHRH
jgi:hypothetical protein